MGGICSSIHPNESSYAVIISDARSKKCSAQADLPGSLKPWTETSWLVQVARMAHHGSWQHGAEEPAENTALQQWH